VRYPFLRNDPGGDVDIKITADGLCFVAEGGNSATLEWNRIARVELFCGQIGRNPLIAVRPDDRPVVFYCELRLRDGKRLLLTSVETWASGRAVELPGQYRAFILLLHERLQAANSRARFRSGLSWPRFFGWALTKGSWAVSGGPSSLAFALLHRDGRNAVLRNLPRRYQPNKVPQQLLPSD